MAVQTLIAALAAQCREAREDADAKHGDVFAAFDRENRPQTIKTVERFEEGLTWPRNPQATVDAYANLAGLPAWELWQMAIDRWQAAQAQASDAEQPDTDRDKATAPGSQGKGSDLESSAGRGFQAPPRSDQKRKQA